MGAMICLHDGNQLPRDKAERKLELLREQHRRREAKRLETEREVILANCSTLHGFIREFWYVLEPTAPFVSGWAVETMCEHLEAVHRGDIQNLLITVPPGMMKSLLVSVFFQAWEWGPQGRADLRYLATSYSEDNVLRDSGKVRKLAESEKYQALWGDDVRRSSKWGERKFENTKGGNRDCRPFGSLTGGRGDRVLIDDPHSTKSAESDVQREETVKLFREGATDRLNDISKSATIVIMQRLHEKDVAGEILALDIGYVHLNLPMTFEALRTQDDKVTGGPCRTYVGGKLFFEDPRTEDGELLFPERFPAEKLETLKRAKGSYAWAGQYQQRPAPREGGMFKRHWFPVVGSVPMHALSRVRKWDLAATAEGGAGDPDWTAGLLMALGRDGLIYIEDVIRFRGSPAEVERTLVSTASADADRFGVVRIGLNQDPGQAGKSQISYLARALIGHTVEFERETGSKEVRAGPLAAQAEAGNVRIVAGHWNEAFLAELEVFPSGSHDDQVDAGSGALSMIATSNLASWAKLAG